MGYYEGILSEDGKIVDDEKAFDYAFDRCNGQDRDAFEKEFGKTFVGWFYSGNWIRREGELDE